MNRTSRLSKTGIEYLEYVWNFASGCTNGCEYCWARKITNRFKDRYPNGFEPTIYPEALLSPLYLKKPSRIGVCFMGDLFDEAIDPNQRHLLRGFTEDGSSWDDISLKRIIYYVTETCPQHQFLFLTKQPQELAKWSPFPDNCWVGITCVDSIALRGSIDWIRAIQASVRYISFEPLAGPLSANALKQIKYVDWLIIGAQTKPPAYQISGEHGRVQLPRVEWVREIVEAADKPGVKVFLKNNMMPLMMRVYEKAGCINNFFQGGDGITPVLRQELPDGH